MINTTRIIVIIISLLPFYSFGQGNRKGYHSTIWWNEVNFKGKLGGKWFYQGDFQLRTASDATNKTDAEVTNPFKNVLQLQFRPFIGYEILDNLQFMLAPGIAPTWTDFRSDHPSYTLEYRITPQFQLRQNIGRFALTHRYRFEFRWFGKGMNSDNNFTQMFDGNTYTYDDTKSKYRFRYMFRIICPLNGEKIEQGTYYLNLFDEIHVNIGKNVPSTQQIDQNRLNFGLGYRFGRDVRLEIGPFIQTVFVGNGGNTNVFNNHGVQFFIIFNDMKKLFKGENKTPIPASTEIIPAK
jgi:hypothetical protein